MPRSASVTSRSSTSKTTPTFPNSTGMLDGEGVLSQTRSHATTSSGTYDSQLSGSGQSGQGQTPMTSDEESQSEGIMGEEGKRPEREDSGETVRMSYGQGVAA